MGNSNPVYIRTDHPGYLPGSELSGEVCLNVTKPLKVSALHLRIYGTEHHQWTDTSPGESKRRRKKKQSQFEKSEKKSIFHIYAMLALFSDDLPVGSHSYPFSLLLPPFLPGSNLFKRKKVQSEVKYKVKALLIGPDCVTPLYKHSQEFSVLQRVPLEFLQDGVFIRKEIRESRFFCLPFRSSFLTVSLDRSYYMAGDTAKIRLQMQNTGRINTDKIKISLCSYFTLTSLQNSFTVQEVLLRTSCEGISSSDREINRLVPLSLPSNITEHTSRGAASDLQYVVRVEISSLCISPTYFEIPLILHPRIPTTNEWVAEIQKGKPSSWKPLLHLNTHLNTPYVKHTPLIVWAGIDLSRSQRRSKDRERLEVKRIDDKANREEKKGDREFLSINPILNNENYSFEKKSFPSSPTAPGIGQLQRSFSGKGSKKAEEQEKETNFANSPLSFPGELLVPFKDQMKSETYTPISK